jgi:hypothetical protein
MWTPNQVFSLIYASMWSGCDLKTLTITEAFNIVSATRSNFLLQKGEEHNSAVIALRDSLDGPQEVQLELILRLTTNGIFVGEYVANLIIYVSQYRPQSYHRHYFFHSHRENNLLL